MKKRLLCIVLGIVLGQVVGVAWGVPNLINYQGRLSSGGNSVNSNVDMKFGIYDATTEGSLLWQETQNVSVNNGVFNVLLGSSNPLNLSFDKDYWLGVTVGTDSEMSPRQRLVLVGYSFRAGTASYATGAGTATYSLNADKLDGKEPGQLIVGTASIALDSQRLEGKTAAELTVGTASYSYRAGTATYAETAGTAPGTATYAIHAGTATYALSAGGAGGGHYIGELYGGGIVFWVDSSGQHGLIATTADQGIGIYWYSLNGLFPKTNAVRDGIYAGKYNTESIIAASQATPRRTGGSYAAEICANYQGGGYGDWYLPSKYELNLLYQQRNIVGGFADTYYWGSGSLQYFGSGDQPNVSDDERFSVRAVRAF